MHIKPRIKIFIHWLLGAKNNVSFKMLWDRMCEPPRRVLAQKLIKKISHRRNYTVCYFRNFSKPLYCPKNMPKQEIYGITYDILLKRNWHYYEKAVTRVNHHDIVVDCGASEGLFSLSVINKCQKIYAIEPNPIFIDALKQTFKNDRKVNIVPLALSHKKGRGYLEDLSIGSFLSTQKTRTPIKIDTVDNLFHKQNKKMTYLKIDVEGSEYNLLRGAMRTIKAYSPKIVVAAYHRPGDASRIIKLIKKINPLYQYQAHGVTSYNSEPVLLHFWAKRHWAESA